VAGSRFRADLEAVILDLLEGQYNSAIRDVSFNTAEYWSQDVSADVAYELRRRCDLKRRTVPCRISSITTRAGKRHSAAAADPSGLTVAFHRKKTAAIGVKAPSRCVHRVFPPDDLDIDHLSGPCP
jgi:hypothetical protein